MKKFLFILLLSIPFVLPAQSLTKLRVTPQWMPQSQFSGIYSACLNGFYKEAGLDVEIIYPAASISSAKMLASGQTDIITSQLIEAIVYRDEGLDLVNVLQTSIHNSLMILSREPLDGVNSLNGKKIGRWKAGFSELGMALATSQGLDVEWVPFSTNIALYISGAIDATLCMEYNEYYQLLLSGTKVTPEQVLKFKDIGFDIPEDGMYVKEEFYATHKDVIVKFVEATKKGWEWARKMENRSAILDYVMEEARRYNTSTNRVNQAHMLTTILNSQIEEDGTAPFELARERFNFAKNLLLNNNFIINDISYEDFVKQN